ncbi:hypothetical protein REMIM1_PF00335 (plasmid) [Rhizobium etli bv. mimosae str. Mim1]|nr:hypothetical protein REMIM1_PF00335 [Rhizobium etli bv. mimosae str. Mim1]
MPEVSPSEEANESRWRHHDETHPTIPPQNAIHLIAGPASDLCDTRPRCDRAGRPRRYLRPGRTSRRQARPNIDFDTMGHDPAIIRTLTGSFGAERVLADTDWPTFLPRSIKKASPQAWWRRD